jgi:hypothetical protein
MMDNRWGRRLSPTTGALEVDSSEQRSSDRAPGFGETEDGQEYSSPRFRSESDCIGGKYSRRIPSYAGVEGLDFRWEGYGVGCNESASEVECLREKPAPPECMPPSMMTTSLGFVSFGMFFVVATPSRFESENDLRVVVLVGIGAVDDRCRVGRGCIVSPMPIWVAGRDSIFREVASV